MSQWIACDGAMPMLAPETLALVTVTHNSAAELEALLTSIDRYLPGVELVVVDSASSDETVAVARSGGRVQTIVLEQNVGFGRGCNVGVAAVTQPVTALLNPDVELLDDSLLELAAEALRPPERLLAPLVLNSDGSRQDTVHPRPTSPSDLGTGARAAAGLTPRRAALPLAPWRSDRPDGSDGRSGARSSRAPRRCASPGPVRRADLHVSARTSTSACARPRSGVETWFWPPARVVHHRAHSTRAEFGGEPFELLARARRDVVARRLGPRRAGLDDAARPLRSRRGS